MEKLNPEEKIRQWLHKYKYAILILAVGVLLMLLPEDTQQSQEEAGISVDTVEEASMQAHLQEILSQIEGAGEVRVLLSEQTGSQTIYQTDTRSDTDDTGGSEQSDTVIITDAQRNELGLVRRTDPPIYMGAVVVCQGADQAGVRLAIVEAVQCATGLGANQISVVKMK